MLTLLYESLSVLLDTDFKLLFVSKCRYLKVVENIKNFFFCDKHAIVKFIFSIYFNGDVV